MISLENFEAALVIAKKHNIKNFTLGTEVMVVEMADELIEIPVSEFNPEDDTMITEQQFNEGEDYLITNPTTMG